MLEAMKFSKFLRPTRWGSVLALFLFLCFLPLFKFEKCVLWNSNQIMFEVNDTGLQTGSMGEKECTSGIHASFFSRYMQPHKSRIDNNSPILLLLSPQLQFGVTGLSGAYLLSVIFTRIYGDPKEGM